MKTRKSIARLLSFLMVLSLLLGISAAPVYAVGGEGETASFEITEANGQTGTVQYKLDDGEFTDADGTPVSLSGVSSITIKATPVADAQVNQSHSGITGTEHAVSFDYTDLTSESGWTYQIQDNDGSITFAIEFDNNDGTGGGSTPGDEPNPGGGGSEGETASFEIIGANGQTGTVQYKLDGGEFTLADSTPVSLGGVSSITIKATPVADAQVNQSYSGITGTEHAVSFDYTDLTSESGWTYQIQDNDENITFTIVFDNNDGTGGGFNPGGGGGEGGEDTYTVYFGEGSWEIGGVTVTADKTDVQYLAYNDIITLENFDPETMEVRVEAEDGFRTTLAVTDGQTSISAHTNDGGVPADIAFSVVEKSSEPGGGTYTVYFGEGSWEIGGVTVTADKTDVQYLAYNDIITLENFDPETMEVRVEAEDGFSTTLAVTNNQTSISAHTNDGGVPADIAFSVVLKSSGDNGGGDGGDAPVIWDGPQVEHQSDHGFLSVKSIEIGSKTYTYQGEGKFAYNGVVNELLEWRGYNKTSIAEEGGIVVYGDVFTEENVDVFYINFEFKPDYGYQATHVRMTEDDPIPLSDAGFSAAEAIRTFRFAVYPDAHTHFSVIFTATEDIVKANAESILEGGVELATGELDGGSAVLEVNEANVTNQGDFEAAAEGYVVSEYLDISLYNVFYKGNAEDVWSTPVENLDNPAEITLRLEDGINTENVKIVHEKDTGEFEVLPAAYNPATQEITFSTSSFSNYAIAYEEQAQGRYFIDFTNAPWTVDGVEVDLEGRESVAELMVWITTEDVIPLTNFDPDTMDAVLIVDENVTLLLNVDENGNTRLADVDGGVEVLPPYGATLTFAVVAKPGGEGENVYYIDLGTGDWTVGDVTVSAPDGMSGVVPILDTETIPTEMLANFDPETMDITLTVSDGFVIYLEIDENGNTTLASTRDGVELPPYGATLTFAVVEKSSNPGENVYYIDLGTGSWTVGDVTVSAPEGMSGVVSLLDTETIPTEMLANFDPETMDITLTVSDGFVIYLEIDENGNTTLASTRDGVELPPYGATLTFAVVAKPGNLEIVDKTEENTCDIALEETADVLLEKLGLSDTEATRIENGENIQVWIEAEDISETVEESDKQLIESKKGNAVVAMYLNIELYKKIGNDTPSNVTQTKGAITFTIKVPDAFVNTNGTVTRTYQIIRVHNGTAEVLPCTFDAESQIISFETDQFSTYALAYIDQQNSPVTYTVFFAANGGTGTMADVTGISGEYTLPACTFGAPSGQQFKAWSIGRAEKAVGDKITVTANTTVTAVWEDIPAPPSNPDNPQTGDNTHIGLLFVMLLISACGMIVLLFVAPQKKGKYQR